MLHEHPLRTEIYEELHSRPPPFIETPCVVSHLALHIDERERSTESRHLADLCARFDTRPPEPGASCFYRALGQFELRWERHTEFSSYTFVQRTEEERLWARTALDSVPSAWLDGIPGQTVVGLHLAVSASPALPEGSVIECYLEGSPGFGGALRQGSASLYGTFRLCKDGFARIALHASELTPLQAGRLVQRIIEIETYRLMALLALPIARQISPALAQMEEELALLNQRLTVDSDELGQQTLLGELSNLAARVERLRSDTNYRFAATRAYYGLVQERLHEIDETKVPGLQPVGAFIRRRLAPGVRTCNAVRDRLEGLSSRISQASNLLRTRVELSIQSQNRELLSAMNRRGEIQLRLQQAVEGLSVVAVTYYVIGLLSYAYDGLGFLPLPADKKLFVALAIPLVALVVWRALHRASRRIHLG